MKRNISFSYPVAKNCIGGAQLLLVRIIKRLCESHLHNIRVYDYPDGFISWNLQNSNVEGYDFIELKRFSNKIPNLGDETFLITNADILKKAHLLQTHHRVFFLTWDLYFPFWDDFDALFRIRNVSFCLPLLHKIFIKKLLRDKAVIVLDLDGRKRLEKYSCSAFSEKNIVRLPLGGIRNQYEQSYDATKPIRICYIGRAVVWKITPVIKLLKDLNNLSGCFHLTIITDLPKIFEVQINKFLKINNNNVIVCILPSICGGELERYMIENVDLGVGMGTVSLEFAKLGIPTLLVDFSNNEFPDDYKYRWLHENNGNSLGSELPNYNLLGTKSMKEILIEFQENASAIGQASFKYVVDNHDIDVILNKILYFIDNTRGRTSHYTGLLFKIAFFVMYVRCKIKKCCLLER